MKKLFFLSAGFLAFAVIVCNAQKPQQKQKTSSLLWKIEGKNLKNPSYLFGTIHLICADKFLWTEAMKNALDTCEQVAFEVDMDDPKLAMEVSAGMLLPEEKELKDFFSEENYKRLEKYAIDTLRIPAMMLSRMQPFAVLSMAAINSTECDQPPVSYEQKITGWAKASGKNIVGLESAEGQLAIMKEMNIDSTAAQLIKMLNNPEEQKEQYKQLLSVYTQQDLKAIHNLILNTLDIQADLNRLLYGRNKNWIPEIEKLIQDNATFIAIGAGHLGGEDGVIQLLQQKGYTLTPVL